MKNSNPSPFGRNRGKKNAEMLLIPSGTFKKKKKKN